MSILPEDNKQPVFSVIIPVYNVEKYLDECLQSLQKQTYQGFEAVLVDDGSRDRSGEICDDYAQKDSHFSVIHKENGGVTSARTCGVQHAKGEYLLFLDSDDLFEPTLLEVLLQIVKKNAPDCILFGGIRFGGHTEEKYEGMLEEGLYVGEDLSIVRDKILFNEKSIVIPYGVTMKAFRRELYIPHQNTVPSALYKGEDLAVSAPMLASCKSVYVANICGYLYRDTPTSVMNTFREKDVFQISIVAEYLEEKMGKAYRNKIDGYVLLHYYDYLDGAIAKGYSYKEYKKLIQSTLSEDIVTRMRRCSAKNMPLAETVIFCIMRNQWFDILWLIRKVQRMLR